MGIIYTLGTSLSSINRVLLAYYGDFELGHGPLAITPPLLPSLSVRWVESPPPYLSLNNPQPTARSFAWLRPFLLTGRSGYGHFPSLAGLVTAISPNCTAWLRPFPQRVRPGYGHFPTVRPSYGHSPPPCPARFWSFCPTVSRISHISG